MKLVGLGSRAKRGRTVTVTAWLSAHCHMLVWLRGRECMSVGVVEPLVKLVEAGPSGPGQSGAGLSQ